MEGITDFSTTYSPTPKIQQEKEQDHYQRSEHAHVSQGEDFYDYIPVGKVDPSPHSSINFQFNSTESFADMFRKDPYAFYRTLYGEFNFPSDFIIEYSEILRKFPIESLPPLFRELNPHISLENISVMLQECTLAIPKIWNPVQRLRNGALACFVILIFAYFCLLCLSFAFLIFIPNEGLIICLAIMSTISILFIICFIAFVVSIVSVMKFGYWKTADAVNQILVIWNQKYFSSIGIQLSFEIVKNKFYSYVGKGVRYLFLIHFRYPLDKTKPFRMSIASPVEQNSVTEFATTVEELHR